MFFSVKTKKLNWEILTRNLVSCHEKPIYRGELLKEEDGGGGGAGGAWTVCRFKKWGWYPNEQYALSHVWIKF